MTFVRVLSFSDPFQFQASIRAADIEIIPTRGGEFKAELTQATLNKVWIQRLSEELPRVHRGAIKRGRKIVNFLTEDQPEVYHCGRLFDPTEVILDDCDMQHAITRGKYRLGSISLTPEDLVAASTRLVGEEIEIEGARQIIRPAPQVLERFKQLHAMVGNLATATPQLFDVPEVVRSLEHELTYLLVKCLTEREAPTLCTRALRHEAIVARFEDYLEANQNTPLYLAQVCEAIGTAERTLRAACEQHLGLGPIRYLALRRMNLTRRALMAADPSTATVTQIATEFGFWELGRFSVAYRALFGETPSATLRRPAVDVREPFTRPSSLPGIARARGS